MAKLPVAPDKKENSRDVTIPKVPFKFWAQAKSIFLHRGRDCNAYRPSEKCQEVNLMK